MFVRYVLILILFSIYFGDVQAAALVDSTSDDTSAISPKSPIIPSTSIQIEDWVKIFDAHRDQDLTTVPMPELIHKVHQAVAYVTPVLQDAEARAILNQYFEEVTAAHSANTLTFSLYAKFMLGTIALMNPEKWKPIEGYVGYMHPSEREALKASLNSEVWWGNNNMPGGRRETYNEIMQMIQFGMKPNFILCPKGHFGYESIVKAYLRSDSPYHLMGIPLKDAEAHGTLRSVFNFVSHDVGHGSQFVTAFKHIWPIIQKIFQPVLTSSSESTIHRRNMAALYFLFHETGLIAEELHAVVQKNLEGTLVDLGSSILEAAKMHFTNAFLNEFLGMWSSVFQKKGGTFGLRVRSDLVVTNEKVSFKGAVHHGPAKGIFVPTYKCPAPSADLEEGIFTIYFPSDLIGKYRVEIEPGRSYMDTLRKIRADISTYYNHTLEAFYEGAVLTEGTSAGRHPKYTLELQAPKPYETYRTTLQDIFDGSHIDELGTEEWIRTGKFNVPHLEDKWENVIRARTFFDRLFTEVQRDWATIWAAQPPLDRALIASTRAALEAYFAKRTDGSVEDVSTSAADATANDMSMGASRGSMAAGGAGASAV